MGQFDTQVCVCPLGLPHSRAPKPGCLGTWTVALLPCSQASPASLLTTHPVLQSLFCTLLPPLSLKNEVKAGLQKPTNGSSSLQIGQPQCQNKDQEGATWGVAEGMPEGGSGHLGSSYVISGKSFLLPSLSFLLCQMRLTTPVLPLSSPSDGAPAGQCLHFP